MILPLTFTNTPRSNRLRITACKFSDKDSRAASCAESRSGYLSPSTSSTCRGAVFFTLFLVLIIGPNQKLGRLSGSTRLIDSSSSLHFSYSDGLYQARTRPSARRCHLPRMVGILESAFSRIVIRLNVFFLLQPRVIVFIGVIVKLPTRLNSRRLQSDYEDSRRFCESR